MVKAKNGSMKCVLALLMAVSVILSACGGNNAGNSGSNAAPANGAAGDSKNTKEVKLVGYLLGDAPKGMPKVLEEMNKKLKEKINATLELNYIGWADVQSKYPLVLATGDNVDFIFAADWNFYVQQATKGAFLPLTDEMLKANMPLHYAKLDPAAWKAAEIKGEIFMVPTSTPDRKVNVAVIRKDLREKYGVAEVKRFSELGPYLEAIQKNEPEMIGLNLDSQFDLPMPYQFLLRDKIGYVEAPLDSGNPMSQGIAYDFEESSGKLISMVEEPYLGAQKYAAGIMKDWYDKGYVNKNPYANKVRSKDNFPEGKAAVAFGNSLDIAAMLEASANKGIETEIISATTSQGHAPQNSWLNNGLAVAASSMNPERALQAMDLIMEDQEFVNLTAFGIEGENYVVTADNKIALPEGVTTESNTFPPDSSGFWFTNKDYLKPMASWSEQYIKHREEVKQMLIPVAYGSFSFNSDKVKTEIANLANVSTQYASPIMVGAVKNVEEAFGTLADKLKAAGIDDVKQELEAQTAEFLKNQQ